MPSVLIIDDDEMMLNVVHKTLEDFGYTVHATADGPQGISIYTSQHPDVVLLDLGLPSMSGLDVLREIREADPAAKIIMVSGYGANETVNQALKSGVYDFVHKPFKSDVLLEKIRAAIGS